MVLIMMDQLTKEKHYVPYTIDKNDITTKVTVDLLLNNLYQLYLIKTFSLS